MKRYLSILIVDEMPIIQSGVKILLESHIKILDIKTSSSKEELLILAQEESFDFIITDIYIRGESIFEDLKYLSQLHPEVSIIIYTDTINGTMEDKLKEYFSGIVLKNHNEKELIDGIKNALNEDKKHHLKRRDIFIETDLLTDRELEVLDLICREHTTSDISERLFISRNTVESHRKKLFVKFGVKNVAGLVKRALQLKFIS